MGGDEGRRRARAPAAATPRSPTGSGPAYLKALAVENCASGFQFRAGDAANFAIGQGDIAVTPCRWREVYAAIANGGTVVTPQVARRSSTRDRRRSRPSPPAAGTARCRATVAPSCAARCAAWSPRARGAGVRRVSGGLAGRRQDRHRRGVRQAGHVVVRLLRPGDTPRYAVAVVVAQGGTGGHRRAGGPRGARDAPSAGMRGPRQRPIGWRHG